jgi:hypothetical protein
METHNHLPFVSVVTPTYNRRRFLPLAVACYRRQTYPKSRMEWVVIDDGQDDVSDFFAALTLAEPELNIRFIRRPTRARIGAKRNDLHREARGDIIVAWDDDDYYPPERVAHVVECFAAAPDVQVAGCSLLYIYFSDVKQIYRLGPFTRRHATNGTMAVRRAFALTHFYDENVSVGEEESFLEQFSYPMVQLSPLKVMLVMSHNSNTFEKNILRDNPRALSARTDLTLETFIPDAELCAAFRATSEAVAEAFKALPAPAPAAPAAPAPAVSAPAELSAHLVLRAKIAQRQPLKVAVGHLAQKFTSSIVAAVCKQLAACTQVIIVDAASASDVRILQVLEADAYPNNTFTFVISGESWHQKTRADVVVAPVRTGNAEAVVYFPFLYMSMDERRQTAACLLNPAFGERPNLCAFMYSAPCEHRNKMFDDLAAAIKVDALGAQRNPGFQAQASTRNTYGADATYNDIAVATYRKYKYVLAVENAWVDGYFTEKLLNPILAGAVPLYWGHPAAFEYVNKARVIYIPDYPTVGDLAAAIAAKTDAEWAAIVAEPLYTPKGDPAQMRRRLDIGLGVALAPLKAAMPTLQNANAIANAPPASAPLAGAPLARAPLAGAPLVSAPLAGLPPVFYINLDRRPDRRSHMEEQFRKFGMPPDDYARIPATDGEAAATTVVAAPPGLRWAEVACTVSHLRAIQEWLCRPNSAAPGSLAADAALICEDDLSLETVPFWGCDWRAIEAALPLHWDVLQLAIIYGAMDAEGRPKAVMGLHYRADSDFSTCAYLIRRPYARRLISTLWDAQTRRWRFPEAPGRLTAEEVLYRPARCLSFPLFTYLDGAPGAAGAIAASDIQSPGHVAALHTRSREAVLAAWPLQTALKALRM